MVSTARRTLGLLLLVLPVVATAQSPGTVTEERVTTETNGGRPDTVMMRTISSRGRSRIDAAGGRMLTEPWRSLGTTYISVPGDSGLTITYLDSTRKTYWATNIGSALSGALKALSVKPLPSAAHSSLDSLGDGGIVAGFRTLHFRGHATSGMTMNVMGNSTTWADTTTTDYYVAPGLVLDTLGAATPSAAHRARPDTGRSHSTSIDTVLKQLAGETSGDVLKARAAMQRMNKLGAIVKTVAEARVTVNDGVKLTRTTTELVSHKTMVVPDSLFAVPAGYAKTMPGFMPVR